MLDRLIIELDKGLRTLLAEAHSTRQHPDRDFAEVPLERAEKKHAAALMRVNHSGEVCAQALYSGQSLTAKNPATVEALKEAAKEETEHLAWCEERIKSLGGRTSALNPLWYAGSFTMGAIAGALGDKWNLGFLAETELQVEKHLKSHLDSLPAQDTKSRVIVEQMQTDEAKHAATAYEHGAAELPKPIKSGMQLISKLMTRTSYYL
ncbi:MAG: 2-polyprenyl-3-methyl-6-methoxy-1,4-benzoquinone monooxygenase [Methylophilaceae bacterium]|jgi:ubiquinone biosynthesis monooxygenase Coq7|nr:2-polyprenyl-3-methyl-6-methoxy-1,4-benzoquinone monooxygenase [Methyloradius sp.]